jgi:hypothetical protein
MILSRRSFLNSLGLGLGAVGLTGCRTDGNFSLLGYSTRPNYDTSFSTVYIPQFRNKAFQTTPHRELEAELTRAVIREVEAKTPYKHLDDSDRADTELLGTVLSFTKNIVNRTQQNETREVEYVLVVELVWRDLRDGRILTTPRRAEGLIDPSEIPAFDPNNVPIARGPEAPRPVVISTTSRALVELGESSATAQKMAVDRMAIQIISMMEKPWSLNRDR